MRSRQMLNTIANREAVKPGSPCLPQPGQSVKQQRDCQSFDKYSMTDIKLEGQKRLDLLAQRILMERDRIGSIHVRG
jgi:hypothetical protein